MALKLKYETGVAATFQFIVLTVLNFISGISSSVSQCLNGTGGCVSDVVLAILYFLVITVWFGALWLAGFAAQDRRSRRIAQFLILAEGLVFLVGLYGFKRHSQSIISALISLAEIITSAYVAWLAFRLMRAKGGRVRTRARRRPSPPPTKL
jgi:hypothetical protein